MSPNNQPALLPCPFCASTLHLPELCSGLNEWWVLCTNCQAGSKMCMSADSAAHVWNRRWQKLEFRQPQQSEGLRAALETGLRCAEECARNNMGYEADKAQLEDALAALARPASAPVSRSAEEDEATTAKALEALDGMAETWVEKNGIEQQLKTIPLNCTTPEFIDRARALILRFVKLAHTEGLYNGRISHAPAPALSERPAADDKLREALAKSTNAMADILKHDSVHKQELHDCILRNRAALAQPASGGGKKEEVAA